MRLLTILWQMMPKSLQDIMRQIVPYRLRLKLSIKALSTIYPMEIPDIEFKTGMDIILIDLPQRYMPMMPNGLGCVYNALKAAAVKCQVVDCNIIFYHRYHSSKIPQEKNGAADLWDNTSTGEWDKLETIEHFRHWISEVISKLWKRNRK